MGRTIFWATLVAGTLDILSAFLWTAMAGGDAGSVLPTVASGLFGGGVREKAIAPPLGLLIHFAIMLTMVWAYFSIATRFPHLTRHWWFAGLLYGLVLWLVMYGIVLPLRFGTDFPSDRVATLRQLVSHCLLVGLPIAWIAAGSVHRRKSP